MSDALAALTEAMTLAEAADELGLQPSSLRVQISMGRLVGTKVGRSWMVTRAEVERYRGASLGARGRYGRGRPHSRP